MGILKSSFTPMIAAGYNDNEKKCINGNQYQKWVKINIPTHAPNLGIP